MSSKINDAFKLFLRDGTGIEPDGCTIVHRPLVLGPSIELQKTDDLGHLVRWAYHRGYGGGSLTLTLTWDRDELANNLGIRIGDDFLDMAQEWLDTTGGGLAASTGYHLWEDVIREMKREFKDWIASQEPLSGSACGQDVLGTFSQSFSDPKLGGRSSVEITEDAWEARFGPGDLRDTDDEEALRSDIRYIWTMVDDPHSDAHLVFPGRYWINRIGYFIAERPWDDVWIFVRLD